MPPLLFVAPASAARAGKSRPVVDARGGRLLHRVLGHTVDLRRRVELVMTRIEDVHEPEHSLSQNKRKRRVACALAREAASGQCPTAHGRVVTETFGANISQ